MNKYFSCRLEFTNLNVTLLLDCKVGLPELSYELIDINKPILGSSGKTANAT
jgi:hypothetical protein